MNKAVTIKDIATVLCISKQGAKKRADKESWPYIEQSGRGGKQWLYPLATLPKAIREAIFSQQLNAVALVPAVSVAPVVEVNASTDLAVSARCEMTDSQRDVELAIETLFRCIADYPGSETAALRIINEQARLGTLPSHLASAVARCRDKASGVRKTDDAISRSTVQKWKKRKELTGTYAPRKPQKDMRIKPWHALAVALKQRPQGSIHSWIQQQLQAQFGAEAPSYDVLCRFYREKFSSGEQLKGRHLGSALSAHKFYQHRTSDGMAPWQEVHADGWNTHFTAPHPVTGEFVTYEVWHFHDVATRFVTPPGIGLTENFEVIVAGLARCVAVGGIMALLQTDSTKIIKGSDRFTADPVVSLADRAGFTVVHPKVGNSQANGIPENFNKYLDRRSRELATYQARGMDSLTLKRVKKITAKMVKAQSAGDALEANQLRQEATRMGKGYVFASRDDAVAWINRIHDEFNDLPHSSLKKLRDPATGKMRHQTPREALVEARSEGWEPVMLSSEHMVDLFRIHARKKVMRETVQPYGGMRYFHPELEHWNGKEVMVAYDSMDWRQVWVKSTDGALICVAEFVEAKGYRPQSQNEMALEKRMKAQIKRKEQNIETIETRHQGMLLEHQPTFELPPLAITPAIEHVPVIQEPASHAKPNLATMGDYSQLTWLVDHPEDWTPALRAYFKRQARNGSRTICNALDEYNLWGELGTEDFKVAV